MPDQPDSDLVAKLLEIYHPRYIINQLNQTSQRQWGKGEIRCPSPTLTSRQREVLENLLPKPTTHQHSFRFIDLFAGIGGIRKGFDEAGGLCVFTSEWNKFATRTYKANYYSNPAAHVFNSDIRDITLSSHPDVSEQQALNNIRTGIPDHDVLLAGFPCQPFSLAGVSKKNSLGRAHGFACKTQGTLFFDVARIIQSKQPKAFVLENVKNLKSHNNGRTFRIILETLDELGYQVADADYRGPRDPRIIDAKAFLPQHRERIVLVGLRKDLQIHHDFSLRNIKQYYPDRVAAFGELLDPENQVDQKYILSPRLWKYLLDYASKHKAKGNGFGFGLTGPEDIARTLSARYYKDGSEILVDRGWDHRTGFDDLINQSNRPRRLTPAECARLMGFDGPGETTFRIPVSDTQAYQQFGNSVAVPVFRAIAKMLTPGITSVLNGKGTIAA